MKFFLPLASAGFCPPADQPSEVKACQAFQDAETRMNQSYNSTGERDNAYVSFLENLYEVAEHKKKFPGADFSIDGPYFDWSVVEFNARNNLQFKEYKENPKKLDIIAEDQIKLNAEQKLEFSSTDFSWRKKGGVNPVKNQLRCGSCWAFSTIANIEGVHFQETKTLLNLSESELVDCMKVDHGCHGGLPSYTDKELIEEHRGIESESAYPYVPKDRQCNYDQSKSQVFVISAGVFPHGREDYMKQGLVKLGPLSVGVNATPWMHYRGGVFDPESPYDCDPHGVNHAVTITGYGNADGKEFWEIRNSWGPEWGEAGYIFLVYGKNACGVSVLASTVVKTQAREKEFLE